MAEISRAKKKELAKQIYLRDNLSQKEIAEMVDVSAKTLCSWVNTEKWDTEKAAYTITKEQQIQRLYGHISAVNDTIASREAGENYPNAKEADTLNKLATAIGKMENETSIGDIITVCTKVCSFLRKKGDIEQAKTISDVFNSYIKEVLC